MQRKAWFSLATQAQAQAYAQAQQLLLHWENVLDASISTSARIKTFSFPCACVYVCVRPRFVKTEHNASRKQVFMFFQRKTSVPDSSRFYQETTMAENIVNFDEKFAEVVCNYRVLYGKECKI